MPFASWALTRAATVLTAAAGLYAIVLGILLTPTAQRLYANAFHTLRWQGVHDGTAHGFASNQVTPFNLSTPDGETLYAWHILPLDQYTRHEDKLRSETQSLDGPVDDFTTTTAFKLLTANEPSPARVVVSFHGNAGHIAQGWRPASNRLMATLPNTHVFTIDYRGFGHSTGIPTEAGLIIDGVTLITFIMEITGVPSERIVILGQSLGTAVSSAVALHFADRQSPLLPAAVHAHQPRASSRASSPTAFAGVVLAAPFNSIPTLLLTYRIGGFLPLLLPLRPFPFVAEVLAAKVVDTWQTAERLRAYYNSFKSFPSSRTGSIHILHALDDADIPYHQTEMICRRIFEERDATSALDPDELEQTALIIGSDGPGIFDVKKEGHPRMRFELVEYGGHNKIITYSSVAAAVTRAFQAFGTG